MKSGKVIAMSVAGLLVAGASGMAFAQTATKDAKVKCAGINACKGKGSCSSADNGCKGQNGCKGKGWTETTAKACKDGKGTVVADTPAKK